MTTFWIIIITVFALLLAAKFFSQTARQPVDTQNLLDGGWEYAFSRMPEMGLVLGKDAFFTYGPMANRLPTIILPSNLQRQTSLHLRYMFAVGLIYAFYLYLFVRLYRIHPAYSLAAVTAFLLNPYSQGINDSIVYATVALLGALFFRESREKGPKRFAALFLLSSFSAAVLLYKVPWGIPGPFIALLVSVYALCKRDYLLFRHSLFCLGAFFAFLAVFYFVLTAGSAKDFFQFLLHSFDQVRLYSQMMAVSPYKPEPAFFAAVFFVSLLVLFVFYPSARLPLLFALPSLFAAFKAGFVRADVHMMAFLNSLVLILMCIPLAAGGISGKRQSFLVVRKNRKDDQSIFRSEVALTRNLLLMSVILMSLVFTFWGNKVMVQRSGFDWRSGWGVFRQYHRSGISGYVEDRMKESKGNLAIIAAGVEERVRRTAKDHGLAVIPWNLAITDGLEARPLFWPSLQSYSGYTERLDRANLRFCRSLEKSDHVLMEFASVDSRYPLHDRPRTYEWLLANCEVKEVSSNYLLLAPSETRAEIVCDEPVFIGKSLEFEWNRTGLTAGKAERPPDFERLLVKGLTGMRYFLRAFICRSPVLYLEMRLSDGRNYRFRTFPEFLRRGVWISPYLRYRSDVEAWVNGDRMSLPRVLEVRLRPEKGQEGYFNKEPLVFIQACRLAATH